VIHMNLGLWEKAFPNPSNAKTTLLWKPNVVKLFIKMKESHSSVPLPLIIHNSFFL